MKLGYAMALVRRSARSDASAHIVRLLCVVCTADGTFCWRRDMSLAIVFATGGIDVVLRPREDMAAEFALSVGGEGMARFAVISNFMQLSPFAPIHSVDLDKESHRLGKFCRIALCHFHPSAFGCSRDLQPTQRLPLICLQLCIWRPCLPRQGGAAIWCLLK